MEDIATVYTNIFIKIVRWLRIDSNESLDDDRCLQARSEFKSDVNYLTEFVELSKVVNRMTELIPHLFSQGKMLKFSKIIRKSEK